MNDRIQELSEQVGFDLYSEEKKAMVQEFAELIVRECADLVQGVPTDTMGYHTADQKIKEHFGVEE